MKRIEEIIKIKNIQLDNVKVEFKIKLIQYQLNNIIYKYKNKLAFKEFITSLIADITAIIIQSNIIEDKQGEELTTKAREIIKNCKIYLKNEVITQQEATEATDTMLRYILYQYSKNKADFDFNKQLELLNDLKIIQNIIQANNIIPTDRIKNSYKLIEQLKENIINYIKE